MQKDPEYYRRLLDQYLAAGTGNSAAQLEELFAFLEMRAADPLLSEMLHTHLDQLAAGEQTVPQEAADRMRKRLLEQLNASKKIPATAGKVMPAMPPGRRGHFLKATWFRYAAVILFLFGIGTYLFYNHFNRPADSAFGLNKPPQPEIVPGGNKAVLTLADGQKIILDSAADGSVLQQGSAQVIKISAGQLLYQKNIGTAVGYNTISTPKGGQYQVLLPDGTRVWLNASSSVTFPTTFVAGQRLVKITGEIYFEVAKNTQKPFIVDVNGKLSVEVLGTSFNVNSYADEENIKTTLLEGSVKVIKAGEATVLSPGQQAVAASSDRQLTVVDADISKTLAWKNGIFDFTGADLKSVMRQLERWYDIKVQYKGSLSNITFEGRMYRNVNLSDVLEVLQEMGVKFELNGKNLIVF